MLRMYLVQNWFNLSDEGVEDAIYDSYSIRKFVGIDFYEEDAPDSTTLLNFRRILENHNLNKAFFDAINRVMVQTGHMIKGGTIVDATIINAPSSTKNTEKQRDPEMHQTKKGNEWKFGMKCHIGVDAGTGLVHSMISRYVRLQIDFIHNWLQIAKTSEMDISLTYFAHIIERLDYLRDWLSLRRESLTAGRQVECGFKGYETAGCETLPTY